MASREFEAIQATLRRTVATLRDADVDFLLAGSLASWARGGPESHHDLDLILTPENAERALSALAEAGMRPERPVEGWLYKAWDGDVLVDLIFDPCGLDVEQVIAGGEKLSVLGMSLPTMALEDVLATKLLALSEHRIEYTAPLQMARALREQIDWRRLREQTRGSAYADAFFVLLEGLGVISDQSLSGAAVRVVDPPRDISA
ncbi:MAG TPA: hypothetical protein VEW67_08560 [Thermoleophilaceae bacterium]|nr:hypothetical protein [Thermoleophilaceae bacterium]